ncbi:MAG TPA: hypothetical protein VGK63_02945 [Candidatus Limnocylindrales bacterium]
MALGYLPEIGSIVVATALDADAAKVVGDAAAFHDAPLVVLVEPGQSAPEPLSNAIVLEAPDSEASFDRLVGAFVVRLEAGASAQDALRQVTAAGGWERSA